MALNFEDLQWMKVVRNDERSCVFGYVRECRLLFDAKDTYYHIPDIVKYLCLFYYHQREFFFVHGSNMKLNQEKTRIVSLEKEIANTAFGNVETNPINDNKENIKVYKWELKIIKMRENSNGSLYLGIDSVNPQRNKGICNCSSLDDTNSINSKYCYWDDGYIESNKRIITTVKSLREKDIITIEYNLGKKKLIFYVNGKQKKIQYKQNEIIFRVEYRVVVCLSHPNDCVELMQFSAK